MSFPLTALFIDWLLTALWPITGQLAAVHFDPWLFSEATLFLGFVSLVPFLAMGGRWRRLFEPGLRGPLFCMGALGSGLTGLLQLTAVQYTTAPNAAILCQIEVVYSAFLAAILLRERVTGRQAAATALVLAGTGLILWKDVGTPHWRGDLILLATPWLFQFSHIFSKRFPKDVDYVVIAGARVFYGFLSVAPLVAWRVLAHGGRFELTPASCALLGFQSVFLCSLNLVLWYIAIRNLDLAKTTAILLSYPALTMAYSWLMGQAAAGLPQLAGLLLSMSGALWLTLQVRRTEPAPAAIPIAVLADPA